MIRNKTLTIAVSSLAAVMIFATGCGKKPGSPSDAAPAATDTKTEAAAPAAGVGSIKGKVSFTGTAPVMPDLNRQSDPFCAKTKMKAESVVVNENGTLFNVAIRVIGAEGGEAEAATVTVNQENCMYAPRVQATIFEKEVLIANSDPTLHNVHTYNGSKTIFNRAQPKGVPPMKRTFKESNGNIIKFKCDVHPWMTGWLILNDSGFNAVTSETGEFEIKGVPAGTYTLSAFQETYGQKEIQVTVEADKVAEIEFSYDGSEQAAYKFKEVHIGMAGHQH